MRALLIDKGIITEIDIPEGEEGSRRIHDVIGNWFTSCFTINGVGPDRGIVGYCDDEFLLRDVINWNIVPDMTLRRDMQPIGGPIVVVGLDRRTGESEGLLDVEIEMFRISDDKAVMMIPNHGPMILPFLTFERLAR